MSSMNREKIHMTNDESIRDYLENIISLLPGHIFWKDLNCRFVGCNTLQAQVAGLKSRDEIVGKSAYDIINKNQPESERRKQAFAIDAVDKEIMRTGQTKIIEEPLIDQNGEERIFLSQKVPLKNKNNEIVGLLGIAIDITEQKRLEERLRHASAMAETANQLKTEFIQNMQHDIRTPISGIWSLFNNMTQSKDLRQFRDAIPFAEKASSELLRLCNEVIDFENIEYGDKPIYSHKFSLIDTAHGVINLNSVAAIAHDTRLTLDIANDVPDIIKGDDYRLKKILINLVGNAVKFTEHGQVTLKIQSLVLTERKVSLRFSVIDTGIGIPPEKIDKVFEKFTRLNPSNTGKFKGVGLGLHIVKKFASEIDADLDVVSNVGKGSTFSLDVIFDLPVANLLADESAPHQEAARQLTIQLATEDTDNTEIEQTVAPAPIPTQQEKTSVQADILPMQICFIEDDNLACMAGQAALQQTTRPCKIHVARDAAEALKLLDEQQFDIVISDIGLPDRSGFDITQEVKQNPSHLNYNTPFVALTAHSDDAKRKRGKEVGFLAVYNKPLKVDMAEKILDDFIPTHQETESTSVAVDLALCMKMTGGDMNTVCLMLRTLVDSFTREKPLYFQAFANSDFTQARQLFHKLRGGLSYIRVPTLEHIAAALHEEVKAFEQQNGRLTDLQAKLDDLCDAVDAIANWLEKHNIK